MARAAAARMGESPIERRYLDNPLFAWDVAEDLGWAKTYDAEYIALARSLDCRLVTLDERLRRGAQRLVDIVGPAEI